MLEITKVPVLGTLTSFDLPFQTSVWVMDCPGKRVAQCMSPAAQPFEDQWNNPFNVATKAFGPVTMAAGWFPSLVSVKVNVICWPIS
jgi:hypothetical protein